MRLIDADKITYMWQEYREGKSTKFTDGVTLQSIIQRMPTIEAIEVVRCKDCKHCMKWDNYDTPQYTCKMWTDQWDMATEPNGYCHYGELKV